MRRFRSATQRLISGPRHGRDVDFQLLHSGSHDSASDLTTSDYVFIVVVLLALVGIGFALWHVIKRRRGGEP